MEVSTKDIARDRWKQSRRNKYAHGKRFHPGQSMKTESAPAKDAGPDTQQDRELSNDERSLPVGLSMSDGGLVAQSEGADLEALLHDVDIKQYQAFCRHATAPALELPGEPTPLSDVLLSVNLHQIADTFSALSLLDLVGVPAPYLQAASLPAITMCSLPEVLSCYHPWQRFTPPVENENLRQDSTLTPSSTPSYPAARPQTNHPSSSPTSTRPQNTSPAMSTSMSLETASAPLEHSWCSVPASLPSQLRGLGKEQGMIESGNSPLDFDEVHNLVQSSPEATSSAPNSSAMDDAVDVSRNDAAHSSSQNAERQLGDRLGTSAENNARTRLATPGSTSSAVGKAAAGIGFSDASGRASTETETSAGHNAGTKLGVTAGSDLVIGADSKLGLESVLGAGFAEDSLDALLWGNSTSPRSMPAAPAAFQPATSIHALHPAQQGKPAGRSGSISTTITEKHVHHDHTAQESTFGDDVKKTALGFEFGGKVSVPNERGTELHARTSPGQGDADEDSLDALLGVTSTSSSFSIHPDRDSKPSSGHSSSRPPHSASGMGSSMPVVPATGALGQKVASTHGEDDLDALLGSIATSISTSTQGGISRPGQPQGNISSRPGQPQGSIGSRPNQLPGNISRPSQPQSSTVRPQPGSVHGFTGHSRLTTRSIGMAQSSGLGLDDDDDLDALLAGTGAGSKWR